jgi:hypothetical protein
MSKITKAKRARGMAQVVKCLPSKHEVLSSNPGTTKKIVNKRDRDPCTPMFTAALFTIVKLWEQPRCPETNE